MKDATDLVIFDGYDDWNRALFIVCFNGRTIVDVDGELHTITDEGEPCTPIGYSTPEIKS